MELLLLMIIIRRNQEHQIINDEIVNDIENKNNHSNKQKVSLLFKNSFENNKNPNKRYKLIQKPHSIKDNKNIKIRSSKFKDYLNIYDKDFDKGYNSIDLK